MSTAHTNSNADENGFFYERRDAYTRPSAEIVATLLFELCAPRAVIDVGCGTGTWLSVFKRLGASRVMGIDGQAIPHKYLQLNADEFDVRDLCEPFKLAESYDLAISLEVAEHLPSASAEGFVHSLVRAAPVVAFSAAIPGQGGYQHVNEQWPEYWADMFSRHGYLTVDCIRPAVWTNLVVLPWYVQNTLVFAHQDAIRLSPSLAQARALTDDRRIAMVHPRCVPVTSAYDKGNSERTPSLKWLLSHIPIAARKAISRRLHWKQAKS